MNISEYIENDRPFYHITPSANRDSILTNGLRRMGNVQGICVVRSSDERVLNLIAIGQITTPFVNEDTYCIFKITPSKHKLTVNDIRPDITSEETNPLHNFIRKDTIFVGVDDIYKDNISIKMSDIPYFSSVIEELKRENIIISLEY